MAVAVRLDAAVLRHRAVSPGRRRLAFAAVVMAAAPGTVVAAPARARRVGLLWIRTGTDSRLVEGLREGLRAEGYAVGRDVVVDERFLVGEYAELPAAAAKLVASGVDVIVTFGTTATKAVREATGTIPVVMASSADPVKLGVAASLARPGGNVTGFTSINASTKRTELLKELVPALRRFAVVYYPGSPSEVESARDHEEAARNLGLEVRPVEVPRSEAIESSIAAIRGMDVQAIAFVASTMFGAHRERVARAVAATRLPAVYANLSIAEAGGLAALSSAVADNFVRVAGYVAKILRGSAPATMPIEEISRVQLVVNLRVARDIGVTIPPSVRLRADRVIE